MIGCGQPRLEVAPETSNSEGIRTTSVEDPHCSKKNNGKGQSNCCEQDDQRRCTWPLRLSIDSWDDDILNAPIIACSTVSSAGSATACSATTDCVSDNGHLNGCSIASRRYKFEIPCSELVTVFSMRESAINLLAVGRVNRCDTASAFKDDAESTTDSAPALRRIAVAVKRHVIVDECNAERIGFACIECFRKSFNQDGC